MTHGMILGTKMRARGGSGSAAVNFFVYVRTAYCFTCLGSLAGLARNLSARTSSTVLGPSQIETAGALERRWK